MHDENKLWQLLLLLLFSTLRPSAPPPPTCRRRGGQPGPVCDRRSSRQPGGDCATRALLSACRLRVIVTFFRYLCTTNRCVRAISALFDKRFINGSRNAVLVCCFFSSLPLSFLRLSRGADGQEKKPYRTPPPLQSSISSIAVPHPRRSVFAPAVASSALDTLRRHRHRRRLFVKT